MFLRQLSYCAKSLYVNSTRQFSHCFLQFSWTWLHIFFFSSYTRIFVITVFPCLCHSSQRSWALPLAGFSSDEWVTGGAGPQQILILVWAISKPLQTCWSLLIDHHQHQPLLLQQTWLIHNVYNCWVRNLQQRKGGYRNIQIYVRFNIQRWYVTDSSQCRAYMMSWKQSVTLFAIIVERKISPAHLA